MARALMKLFGDRLALVGMNRGEERVGHWTQKEIDGGSYYFFPACRREFSAKRPLVPARLQFYAGLRRYREAILSLGCRAAFIQASEALLAVSRWKWETVCFWFPGAANPLKVSRYLYAKPLARLFDTALFAALDRVDVILAAADEDGIDTLIARSNRRLTRERLKPLPTCVDTSEFRPTPIENARAQLGIPSNAKVLVNTGRIARLKGWELLVDAFEEFRHRNADSLLFFVGDGEDRYLLERRVRALNLEERVKTTGFQKPHGIASYLNAADAAIFGSFQEGWSVSMLEALACGKPIVTTNVSGAEGMVIPGQNGFIVSNRNPVSFAEAIQNALRLANARYVSTSVASSFDLIRLGERLASTWPPLRLASTS